LIIPYLCGSCAQNNKVSLEERISIALSLKKDTQYTCSSCNQPKMIKSNRIGFSNSIGTNDITRIDDIEEEMTSDEINPGIEQLELF